MVYPVPIREEEAYLNTQTSLPMGLQHIQRLGTIL
jgi:hypothetical protein